MRGYKVVQAFGESIYENVHQCRCCYINQNARKWREKERMFVGQLFGCKRTFVYCRIYARLVR